MGRPNAFSEFTAANGRLTQKHFDHLISLGVDDFAWHCASALVGVEYVITGDGDRYLPQERGNPHYCIPIGDGGPKGEWRALDDLVVFQPSKPDQWKLRFGAGDLLGPDWPQWCCMRKEPLRLYSDPLEWLRGAGQGSCFIDRTINIPLALGNVSVIVCDSFELADRVYAAFNGFEPAPEIRLPRSELNVAA